ncbi:hypothetical protein DQ384_04985 [Sphaerisporangium album]|uniref:Uncharacterized protein n=1 Tax=Sphaerisporangium album TaxID=509200 RepID=A0A367FR10_9ACTN|nr:hypothetical protein [Sphaerisporangium album]RCG32823.1 hypothetical protein DQ384_04985 [Sphaerisporangium album]
MTMLVHITPAKNIRAIRRSGIRAQSLADGSQPGVYCLPVMPSYQLTHQWVRELRRGGQRTLMAVHFRIPDDEEVSVGHYGSHQVRVSSAEATALVTELEDPRGYEVIIPRSIAAKEIHRIRRVNQVTGWRYMPDAHGTRPCPLCNPGQYGAAKIRNSLDEE